MSRLQSEHIKSQLRNALRLVNSQFSSHSLLGPKSVTLSLTNACNTNCVFCPLFSEHSAWEHQNDRLARLSPSAKTQPAGKPRKPFTDFTALEALATDFRAMGVEEVFLAGAGDPIVHPRIEDICELFGAFHQVVLITNGIGLHELRREKLLRHRVTIRLSLHAATPATWKLIHPMNDIKHFEKITEAAAAIQRHHGDRVVIHNVINRINFRESFSMLELAHTLGVREVSYLPVITTDLKNRELFDLASEEKDFLVNELRRVEANALSWGISTNASNYRKVLEAELGGVKVPEQGTLLSHDASNLYEKIDCRIGYVMALISPEQTVRPCCQCKTIGSFKDTSFKEFWNSEAYLEFRRQGRKIRETGGIEGCDCRSCQNFAPNIKIHNALHPLNKL